MFYVYILSKYKVHFTTQESYCDKKTTSLATKLASAIETINTNQMNTVQDLPFLAETTGKTVKGAKFIRLHIALGCHRGTTITIYLRKPIIYCQKMLPCRSLKRPVQKAKVYVCRNIPFGVIGPNGC